MKIDVETATKDQLKMLKAILKFYEFKTYKGIAFIHLETCKHEEPVIVRCEDLGFRYFLSMSGMLEILTTRAREFICGTSTTVSNIFLGCKSLEEVQIKIDLNSSMKV